VIGRIVRSLLAVVILGLVPFAPPTAEAAAVLPPREVYVGSVSYGGTGCPQGTVGSSLSNDRSSLTLAFNQLNAATGTGIPITASRKNCQLNLNLAVPAGWSYAIATVDYRGYVQLPAGVSAEHKTTAYFQGQTAQVSTGVQFAGPVAKDYVSRDTVAPAAQVWMPCGMTTPLNINEQARVIGPANKSAQLTTNSVDGKVTLVLGLQWKRC
jgi:hypothetical protein